MTGFKGYKRVSFLSGLKRIREELSVTYLVIAAFEEAEKNAPAIIFIDELDAIAPKRDKVCVSAPSMVAFRSG